MLLNLYVDCVERILSEVVDVFENTLQASYSVGLVINMLTFVIDCDDLRSKLISQEVFNLWAIFCFTAFKLSDLSGVRVTQIYFPPIIFALRGIFWNLNFVTKINLSTKQWSLISSIFRKTSELDWILQNHFTKAISSRYVNNWSKVTIFSPSKLDIMSYLWHYAKVVHYFFVSFRG